MERFINTLLAATAQWRSDRANCAVNRHLLFTEPDWPVTTGENRRHVAPLLDLLCKMSSYARKVRRQFDRLDALR